MWLSLLSSIIVPVLVKVLEKWVPDMLTRKRQIKWVKERKTRMITRLKRYSLNTLVLSAVVATSGCGALQINKDLKAFKENVTTIAESQLSCVAICDQIKAYVASQIKK